MPSAAAFPVSCGVHDAGTPSPGRLAGAVPLCRILLVLLTLLWAGPAAHAQAGAPVRRVMVGPVEVELPTPRGFVEAADLSPALRQYGETATPPGNRLLAFFVPTADTMAAMNNGSPGLRRYVMVQTLRQAERDVITAQGMSEVKEQLRTQYKSTIVAMQPQVDAFMATTSQKLGAQAGRPELSIKVGESIPLEIFDERATSISMAVLSKVNVSTAAVIREIPLVVAMTTMTIQGKLVYVFVYAVYDGPADLEWARAATLEWLSSLP